MSFKRAPSPSANGLMPHKIAHTADTNSKLWANLSMTDVPVFENHIHVFRLPEGTLVVFTARSPKDEYLRLWSQVSSEGGEGRGYPKNSPPPRPG